MKFENVTGYEAECKLFLRLAESIGRSPSRSPSTGTQLSPGMLFSTGTNKDRPVSRYQCADDVERFSSSEVGCLKTSWTIGLCSGGASDALWDDGMDQRDLLSYMMMQKVRSFIWLICHMRWHEV